MGRMKPLLAISAFLVALMCAGPVIEWGTHHAAVIGAVAFALVCILFAVIGPVADYLGDRR